jgi:LysR family transcriptional regulator, hydrogen peroxide-inducible genes activator
VEISQIRYFLALCDTRSFTRAAKECGVSQPSLSNAIRTLELELGGTLVERAPFGLTPLGKAVRPHLRRAFRHIGAARATAKASGLLIAVNSHRLVDARRGRTAGAGPGDCL